MTDDADLLRQYARNRSESAFAELVRRHLDLVYSAALRQVNGDAHLAQDVSQLVFTDLARKAAGLENHRSLAGWLFTSTRFAAANLVRGERRRQLREQEAQLMQASSTSDPTDSLDWERVRPVLDEALAELDEPDRDAILWRYLEGCDFAQVGSRLSLSGNAARMRVDRAVDKLRLVLERRGIASTAAALGLALANQAIVAAPAGLTATVTGTALAAGGGTAATLTFMSLTKLQLGLAGAVIAIGAGTYIVQEQGNAALRAELADLPPPPGDLVALRQSNRELERTSAQVVNLQVSDAELLRLRDETVAVQARLRAATHPPAGTVASLPGLVAVKFDQLDRKPRPTLMVEPVYPAEMARAGIVGKVAVSFVIDSSGQVRDAKAVESSRPEFETPAVEAVSKWKFDPGLKGGRMVNTRVTQVLQFDLEKGDRPSSPGIWF